MKSIAMDKFEMNISDSKLVTSRNSLFFGIVDGRDTLINNEL